ncbi:MAG: YraN family protein [Candidatus Kaistia colombiensis]|nr:MAG: YraN family protein [Kaistia sp.]
MARPDRRASERRGRFAETVAALYLNLKGYRTVARRFRSPLGEIDLVMRRGGLLVFVEVKARRRRDAAILAITPAARDRLIRAAESFIARHPQAAGLTLRFDIVAVLPRRLPYHIVDAFACDR